MHATGMHKETWEVTIKGLFSICQDRHSTHIRDVFSIESPNHGESAILNEVAIQQHFGDNCKSGLKMPRDYSAFKLLPLVGSPTDYARAAHIFLTAGTLAGAKVDFSRRKLIGVGHSIGAAALCVVCAFYYPALSDKIMLFQLPLEGLRA